MRAACCSQRARVWATLSRRRSRWTSSPSSRRSCPPRWRCCAAETAPASARGVARGRPHRGATLAAAGRARDDVRGGWVAIRHRGEGARRALRPGLQRGRHARVDERVLGRLADAHRAGEAAHRGNPEVLLLDEPTNHLDLESVKWLESFLRSYYGHRCRGQPRPRVHGQHGRPRGRDRQRRGQRSTRATTSAYLRQREERLRALCAHEAAKQAEEIAHMEAFVEKFRYKATKAKQVQDRVKKLETHPAHRRFPKRRRRCISTSSSRHARAICVVRPERGLRKSYGDKHVYEGLGLHASTAARRWRSSGPNGAGKSTLLKMIAGVLEPDAGNDRVRHARDEDSYYAQHQLEELTSGNTVFEELDHVAPGWTITPGAHAAGRVPVQGRRRRQEGERALRRREEPPRAGEDARRAARRCSAWTSRPTTWTSLAPTSSSRR